MRWSVSDWFGALSLSTLLAVSFGWSLSTLDMLSAENKLAELAERYTQGFQAGDGIVEANRILDLYGTSCRAEIRQSDVALKVNLAESTGFKPEETATAVEAVRQQLTCAPTSGKAWLIYAGLQIHQKVSLNDIRESLVLSEKWAPRERQVVEQRPLISCSIPGLEPGDRIVDMIRRDFIKLIEAKLFSPALSVYRSCPMSYREILDAAILGLAQKEKMEFIRRLARDAAGTK